MYLVTFAMVLSLILSQQALAQQYSAILILDPIPSNVKHGTEITFSGQLYTTSDHVIQDATIYIKDDVDFGIDDVLGSVTTDENGEFVATWTAEPRSSGAWDFYATYEGAFYF